MPPILAILAILGLACCLGPLLPHPAPPPPPSACSLPSPPTHTCAFNCPVPSRRFFVLTLRPPPPQLSSGRLELKLDLSARLRSTSFAQLLTMDLARAQVGQGMCVCVGGVNLARAQVGQGMCVCGGVNLAMAQVGQGMCMGGVNDHEPGQGTGGAG